MEQLKWKQKFMTVAIGQTVSLVGSSAVQFALIWWIASETQSPLMLGMSGMVAYLPIILLSPLAGVLADRVNRKLICISADMFIGLAAAVFAVMMWKFELPVWSALLVLLVRGDWKYVSPAVYSGDHTADRSARGAGAGEWMVAVYAVRSLHAGTGYRRGALCGMSASGSPAE